MPQMQLPFFPNGATAITNHLSFQKQDGTVVYFNGSLPVFQHHESDIASFRMITAQFVVSEHATQSEIVRAFKVPKITVKRAVKCFRELGPKGFYAPKNRRGPAVLTAPVIAKAQALLDNGKAPNAVADELEIKRDTFAKAIKAGRLHARKPDPVSSALHAPSKSERSCRDAEAPMGMGAGNVEGRIAASFGRLNAVEPEFIAAVDVPNGGILLALPALLGFGLIESAPEHLELPKGYYGLDSLLLLLAFMALARLDSIESLRYKAPGEWGKLLGLDRIPEVRTLRSKIRLLANEGKAEPWSVALAQRWMDADPKQAGVLYVDGHPRVYHGEQTKLPRHYIARERLCLRATTDYWVNAMGGLPFFVVNQVVDPGIIQVIENDIVPRLLREVPEQPAAEDLAAERHRHRFTVVFDREGYSPEFIARMKALRIACLTYHKYPGADWAADEFCENRVTLHSGEEVTMLLAERGSCLSNGLWVREIRKLTASGHQTSILSTDYRADLTAVARTMFARWAQENFFKYARQHYGLDRLIDYRIEPVSDTTMVVNPEWRALDAQVRKTSAQVRRLHAKFGALTIDQEIEPENVEPIVVRKSALQEQIELVQADLEALKKSRKETDHRIPVAALPEADRFEQLSTHGKRLVDTVKMVAYRAETAMAGILRPLLAHPNEARCFLRAIYTTEADLIPDYSRITLTVSLHSMANESSNAMVKKLCEELTETETVFPRSNLRLVFKLGTTQNPGDQVI